LTVRLAEIVTSLSVAMDYGMGVPVEFAMNACLLGLRVGEAMGMDESELRKVYYQALLSNIGCNAESQVAAAIGGDEMMLRHEMAKVDAGRVNEVIGVVARLIRGQHAGESRWSIYRSIFAGIVGMSGLKAYFASHCEVAERLALRLGLEQTIAAGLTQTFERWDGKGFPNGIKGEAIAPAVQLVNACRDALFFYQLEGAGSAIATLKKRRGGGYGPKIADAFLAQGEGVFSVLGDDSPVERVLESEPGSRTLLSSVHLDSACEAMADFVDVKSPFTVNHSRRVSALASAAARSAGLAADAKNLERAGLLHELGRTGIAVSIWDKPGRLGSLEWEKVRLAPYYTERILAPSPLLSGIGDVATLNNERLDGSGYYRRLPAPMLPAAARILQAADVFCGMTEDRAYRPAHAPEAAESEINRLVRAGKIDGDAARSIFAAAGGRPPERKVMVAGLSEREVEVLRLLARGKTMKTIATELVIAPKTVDRHIQNIYTKIDVSTRAAATLFALEHNLL
jgi:HD-GYP domain-containing protein (c-di-GMP phosphodiesterase class II)